jgi:hypothetical protein
MTDYNLPKNTKRHDSGSGFSTRMTATSTRRAILAGAAALPALSLPAIASPDPIFATIERHRKAQAAHTAAFDKEDLDRTGDHAHAVLAELVATTPVTIVGCAALLRHVGDHFTGLGEGNLFEG